MNETNTMVVQARMLALAHGGSCVGQTVTGPEEFIGKKVFVPFTAPGELVEVLVLNDKRGYAEGKCLRVIEAAGSRREPPCVYFMACGGCDLQHMNIADQREAKRNMVETTLRVQGKLRADEGVQLVAVDLPETGCRRRVGLHVNENGDVGFYRAGTGQVVNVERCILATDSINQILGVVRRLACRFSRHVEGVLLEDREGEVFCRWKLRPEADYPFSGSEELTASLPHAEIERGGEQLSENETDLDANTVGRFSQTNAEANETLVKIVLNNLTGDQITECYAGSGNFTLPLARRGAFVEAVEADAALVELGRQRAEQEGLGSKITFIESSCEKFLRKGKLRSSVVLDPPRSGAKAVCEALSVKTTSHVTYVSCSLPTFVRDATILSHSGYVLERVLVLDMFPQTHHVEMVSVFRVK